MKHRNKIARLHRKQKVYEEKLATEKGFTKPGSTRKC